MIQLDGPPPHVDRAMWSKTALDSVKFTRSAVMTGSVGGVCESDSDKGVNMDSSGSPRKGAGPL